MEVLVYGGWFGSGNLGDEAILIGVRKILEEHLPEARLTALSIDPQYTKAACGVEAVKLESPRTVIKNRKTYFDLFREADACIVIGGTPFYDYGHLSRIIHMGLPSINEKKLICFGVGSKPITSLKGREITRRLLRHSLLISTRDLPSKNILMGMLRNGSRLAPRLDLTGDSGLFMDPSVRTRGKGNTVFFCPRRLMDSNRELFHEKIDVSTIGRVRHMQAIAADNLVESGYDVVFMPLHTVHPDNDLEEIRVIRNLMKKDARVVPRPGSPERALRMISESALVVGMRLHSLVLAASCGVPFTSIDYDIKIGGFMDHMDLGGLKCSPEGGLMELAEKTGSILDKRRVISRKISGRIIEVRRLISTDADRLAEAVRRLVDPQSRIGHPLLDTRIR